jgi:serine/arginine repetitive matrix protein 2
LDFLARKSSDDHTFSKASPKSLPNVIVISSIIQMYNGIGLRTPRGTGTSGYVEQNLASTKTNSSHTAPSPSPVISHRVSKALEDFDTKRSIELTCYKEKKKLQSQNATPEEIEQSLTPLRESLTQNCPDLSKKNNETH